MGDIQKKIEAYNKQILDKMALLHALLPNDEMKQYLVSIAKLMGERDDTFNSFVKSTMSGVKEHADNIHTFIKYLQFDLEATRRERDKYLKQLNGEQEDADG